MNETNINKLDIKEFLDQDEKKDQLRLLTAGSVDDGKSTLIGRLLFDSKKLYEDQLEEKTIFGGEGDKDKLKINPTVMTKVTWDDPVMQEEILITLSFLMD